MYKKWFIFAQWKTSKHLKVPLLCICVLNRQGRGRGGGGRTVAWWTRTIKWQLRDAAGVRTTARTVLDAPEEARGAGLPSLRTQRLHPDLIIPYLPPTICAVPCTTDRGRKWVGKAAGQTAFLLSVHNMESSPGLVLNLLRCTMPPNAHLNLTQTHSLHSDVDNQISFCHCIFSFGTIQMSNRYHSILVASIYWLSWLGLPCTLYLVTIVILNIHNLAMWKWWHCATITDKTAGVIVT